MLARRFRGWKRRTRRHEDLCLIRYAMLDVVTKNWMVMEPAQVAFLRSLPEHPLLMQVLFNRGLRTAEEVNAFLANDDAVVENPYRLRDVTPAVGRLLRALENQETVCVYGDFDADGVSATALLVSALQAAGGEVGAYIPNRVDEGYGLNCDAIEMIAAKASVLVTVDCGIRSLDEVRYAGSLGMDVIVTDHHTIGPELPPALAVINPRRLDDSGGFAKLAGAGVAYRLAQAVLRAAAHHSWCALTAEDVEELELSLLEFVAIGTVADLMPLLGENRSLVRRGLKQLNSTERPGLQELMALAGLRPGSVDTSAISFRIGPRINAAGRLASAQLAYRLLRTNDHVEGYALAAELETLNERRRAMTADAEKLAEEQAVAAIAHGDPLLTVSSPDIASGVAGLVAGRLTDRYYRPAVVVEEGDPHSRGSARSIEEFDISRALDELSHLLVRHGGHSRAAGFTVETAALTQLMDALQEIALRDLGDLGDLRPTLEIDVETPLADVDWALLEQFERLEPTGQENPQPTLLSRNVRVREARLVGGEKHLRLIVDSGPQSPVLDAIAFSKGDWVHLLPEGAMVDLVFALQSNEWQGRKRLQLNVMDLRLSS
jgi:single-stranded-DNA-specific exonuclease